MSAVNNRPMKTEKTIVRQNDSNENSNKVIRSVDSKKTIISINSTVNNFAVNPTININVNIGVHEPCLIDLDDLSDLIKRIQEKVQTIRQPNPQQNAKKNPDRSSAQITFKIFKERENLNKKREVLNLWILDRHFYNETQKKRLIEFKDLLQSEIHSLLNAIHVLSSRKVRLAKEPGLAKALDNLVAQAISYAPFGGGAGGGLWSYLSPIDYLVNRGEKGRFKKLSSYFATSDKIDQFCKHFSTFMTAYYRLEILDPTRNLTIIERKLEPIKRACSQIKKYFENSSTMAQWVTGTDDEKPKVNIDYKKNWDALCSLFIAKFFSKIPVIGEIFGEDLSISGVEMADRINESLIPISDEPLNFEDEYVPYTLSRLALLVYETEGVIYDFIKNKWQFETHEFFCLDDIQAFLIADDRRIVLSFRGTTTLTNWHLHNLRIQPTEVEGKKVHSGFWQGLIMMQPYIRKAIQKNEDREIYITGHSLGGALALLAAHDLIGYLNNRGSNIFLCTFGQPSCAEKAFVEEIAQKLKAYKRFENYLDPVPYLPNNFGHAGELQWFNAQGKICKEQEKKQEFDRLEREENLTEFHKMVNYLSNTETNAIRTNTLNRILHLSNHWMSAYHEHLRKQASDYTSLRYHEAAFQHSIECPPFEYDGQRYKRKYETRGDGACAIHALCGTLTDGLYVYNPSNEKDWNKVQKAAKQHFGNSVNLKLDNQQIKQLFHDCLQEYYFQYAAEGNPQLKNEYILLLKLKLKVCRKWFSPILEIHDLDFKAKLLDLLRENKKSHSEIDDSQLLDIFKAKPKQLYYAVVAIRDEIKYLIIERVKSEHNRLIQDGEWDEQLVDVLANFLIGLDYLNKLDRRFNKRNNLDFESIKLLYFSNLLNPDYYLSDKEIELAAYVFSKKVILFPQDGSVRVLNPKSEECIAIKHTPDHYSRLDEYEEKFTLPSQDKKYVPKKELPPFCKIPTGVYIARRTLFSLQRVTESMKRAAISAITLRTYSGTFEERMIARHTFFSLQRVTESIKRVTLSIIRPSTYSSTVEQCVLPIPEQLKYEFYHLTVIDRRFFLFERLSCDLKDEAEKIFNHNESFFTDPAFAQNHMLHIASTDQAKYIEFLAEKAIPVNINCKDGNPLLHSIVSLNCNNAFDALLTYAEEGYVENARDDKGNTILHHVVRLNNLKAFKILKKHKKIKALLNVQNAARETALIIAAQLGLMALLERLLDYSEIDLTTTHPESGKTILHYLVEAGAEKQIIYLSKRSQRIFQQIIALENQVADSVLFKTQNQRILELLIKNGIDLTQLQTDTNKTLLYILAKNNDVPLVQLFIKELKKNHLESYQRILDQQVRSSQYNNKTKRQQLKTALIIAAEKNNHVVVRELIEAGANFCNAVDGLTLLDFAPMSFFSSESDKQLWLDLFGNIQRSLTASEQLYVMHIHCLLGDLESTKKLINTKILGVGDTRNSRGDGLLLVVMKSSFSWEQKRILMSLLLVKDNINQADNRGKTPLMYAVFYDFEALQLLLKCPSVRVNHQDNQGNTALHYAASYGQKKTVETLLKHGTNPTLANGEGKTPDKLTNNKKIAAILEKARSEWRES
jgi:ankyrin repeat protein